MHVLVILETLPLNGLKSGRGVVKIFRTLCHISDVHFNQKIEIPENKSTK